MDSEIFITKIIKIITNKNSNQTYKQKITKPISKLILLNRVLYFFQISKLSLTNHIKLNIT